MPAKFVFWMLTRQRWQSTKCTLKDFSFVKCIKKKRRHPATYLQCQGQSQQQEHTKPVLYHANTPGNLEISKNRVK